MGWSRRTLQILVGLNALLAVYKGGAFVVLGIDGVSLVAGAEGPLDVAEPARALLDTWVRVLGWNWLAIGLMAGWIVPGIERHTAWFRLIHVGFMAVGVGRLSALVASGPDPSHAAWHILVELAVPLGFIAWQTQVAHAAARPLR